MIRNVLQFHERPDLIAGAQTIVGRILTWFAGIAALIWHDAGTLMLVAFSLVFLFPDRRRSLLMFMAFAWVAVKFLGRQGIDPAVLLLSAESIEATQLIRFLLQFSAAMAGILALVFAAIRFHALPDIIRRHPLLVVHFGAWLALALSALPRLSFLTIVPFFLWRASYLFKSAAAGNTGNSSLRDHLFYMAPVFGGTNTPYGKGGDYLSRFEAKDPESIAKSSLAGLKLLILAAVWAGVLALMDTLLFGRTDTFLAASLTPWSLPLAQLGDLLQADTALSPVTGWLGLYLELIRATVALAISGHVIVGCLRLLGFNVFRNTYKPLLSESIVEFWNRYYFYFKELLVEFFFYPAFFRSAWAEPQLRLFLAVFAAAFFGNFYYHLLSQPQLLVAGDLPALWAHWGPRLIYCFLLALGIWLSMLRQQRRRAQATRVTGLSRLRAIAGVWTFYGLIHVWNIAPGEIGFAERSRFLMSLVGL